MHEVEAKGILSAQNGMNIYRGCTHGCIYCDARSSCYQMNHAFEDIEVTTKRRIEVLNILRDEGIPTIVWMTPILPFINDTEENIQGLLKACKNARVYGILTFGIGVTLRDGDRQYFYQKLDEHFPGVKEQYIKTYKEAYELPVPQEKKLMGIVREESN